MNFIKKVFKFSIYAFAALFTIALLKVVFSGPAGTPEAATAQAEEAESIALSTNADDLYKDYQANEVSADAKYKGKTLQVQGEVDAISKNFMDDIVIRLKTENMFMSVHAELKNKAQQNTAGQLTKGDQVNLVCKGGGMVVGSPVLNKCVFQ